MKAMTAVMSIIHVVWMALMLSDVSSSTTTIVDIPAGGAAAAKHDYNNNNNKYKTKALKQDLCMYLDDDDCQRRDELHLANIQNLQAQLKEIQTVRKQKKKKKLIRRETQQNEEDYDTNSGISNIDHHKDVVIGGRRKLKVDSKGSLNVLVLLMEFTDHAQANKQLIPKGSIETLFNGLERDSTINLAGSIKQYVQYNSYNQLDIDATVIDWQTTDNTESYYADGRGGYPTSSDSTIEIEDAIIPLLQKMDNQNFDFTKFDVNSDGILDVVIVLHSGYAAQFGDQTNCEPFALKDDRIIDHQQSASSGVWTSKDGSVRLGSFVMASAFSGVCNANSAKTGAVAHEFLHIFGLPDLIDFNMPSDASGLGGIAGFDIMANPRGFGQRLAWPTHMSGWTKASIDWVEPIEITSDGTYEARPCETHPDIYKISKGYQPKEYLLIENRQPILFDERIPPADTGGFVIYHIDETANNKRGYPGQPIGSSGQSWPQSGDHYRVAVLQRDGLYDLEKGENNGDIGDFYVPDQGYTLGPSNGNTIFPNTDSYAIDSYEETGITISNFKVVDSDAGILSFDVSGLGAAPPPPPTDRPTPNPTESPTASLEPTCTGCTRSPTVKPTMAPIKATSDVDSSSFTSKLGIYKIWTLAIVGITTIFVAAWII